MSIPVLFPFLNPIVVVYFLMLSCVSSLYIWDTNPYSEIYCFSSVQSLSCVWLFHPHGLQHAKLPCPLPTPGAYSNSCPLSRWCHPIISSFAIPFSSCLQSFPVSGYFLYKYIIQFSGFSFCRWMLFVRQSFICLFHFRCPCLRKHVQKSIAKTDVKHLTAYVPLGLLWSQVLCFGL